MHIIFILKCIKYEISKSYPRITINLWTVSLLSVTEIYFTRNSAYCAVLSGWDFYLGFVLENSFCESFLGSQ